MYENKSFIRLLNFIIKRFDYKNLKEIEKIDRKSDVNYQDELRNTALHYACQMNIAKVVKLLINKYHADVNLANNKGMTALHYSHSYPFLDTTSILLRSGANPNIKDNDGNTPLLLACTELFYKIDRLIDSPSVDLTSINNNGDTALILLCNSNHNSETINKLVEDIRSIRHTNHYGVTALARNEALYSRSFDLYNKLFRRLLNTDCVNEGQIDHDGKTALLYC